MRLLRPGMALAIAMTLAAPAAAQTAAPAAPTAAPSAHSIELARRLFVVIHMDAMMNGVMANLLPGLIQNEAKNLPGLTPERQAAVVDATEDAAREWFPKVTDRMVVEYARTFTDAELETAIAFYDSPVGRSFIAKQPQLSAISSKITLAMMPDLQQMIQDRVCRKVACPKSAGGPPPQAP